jgi:hypothetical protein
VKSRRTRTLGVAFLTATALTASLAFAGPASATPEPPVTTSSMAREVGYSLGNGWYGNSPVTTTVTTAVSQQVRTRSEDTVESKTEKSTENRTNTTSEERTTDAVHKAQVLPPINPDGSSVWPAKRGVIPVQFKVTKSGKTEERTVSTPQSREVSTTSERTVTTPYTATDTTTTTTTTKTPLFESICGPDDRAYSVIGKYGEIPAGTEVEDVTKVQAGFSWLEGDSRGGSLRWDIGTELGDIHVYYGDSHDWTGPDGTNVNLMDATDDRFDDGNTSVAGKTFYNTKQQILDKFAGVKVNNVSLVVESCWTGSAQRLALDYLTVGINGADSTLSDPLAPKTSVSENIDEGEYVAGSPTNGPWNATNVQEGPWVNGTPVAYGPWTEVSSTTGVLTNEPDAKLVVKKYNDGDPVEVLSETLTSAQADVGGNFRKVDSKYLYNLEASSLGKGDFQVFIQIGGVNLENHGVFTLR